MCPDVQHWLTVSPCAALLRAPSCASNVSPLLSPGQDSHIIPGKWWHTQEKRNQLMWTMGKYKDSILYLWIWWQLQIWAKRNQHYKREILILGKLWHTPPPAPPRRAPEKCFGKWTLKRKYFKRKPTSFLVPISQIIYFQASFWRLIC